MLCEIFVKMSMLTQNAQNSNTKKKMKRDQNTTTLPLLRHCTYHSEVILLRKKSHEVDKENGQTLQKTHVFRPSTWAFRQNCVAATKTSKPSTRNATQNKHTRTTFIDKLEACVIVDSAPRRRVYIPQTVIRMHASMQALHFVLEESCLASVPRGQVFFFSSMVLPKKWERLPNEMSASWLQSTTNLGTMIKGSWDW